MTMTVRFEFVGSVLCFYSKRKWHFDFVGDHHHQAMCSVKRTVAGAPDHVLSNGPLVLLSEIRTATFEPEPRITETPNGADLDKLLNLSGDDMHGTSKGASNLRWKPEPGVSVVRLVLPPFKLTVKETTSDDYYVMRDTDPRDPMPDWSGERRIGPVAKVLQGEFNLEEDGALKFDIGSSIHLKYEAGATYEVKINNDCNNHGGAHDFRLYYKILVDKDWPQVRFLAGKYKQWSSGEKSSEFGNCDPVGSEPPPGP